YSRVFFFSLPPPPRSSLFPYTTLFRSHPRDREPPGPDRDDPGLAVDGLLRPAPRLCAPDRRLYPEHRGSRALQASGARHAGSVRDRKSTRLNSSHVKISYAVFCLKKKK